MKTSIINFFKDYYNSDSFVFKMVLSICFGIFGSVIFLNIGYNDQIPTTIHTQFVVDMVCSFGFAFFIQAYISNLIIE